MGIVRAAFHHRGKLADDRNRAGNIGGFASHAVSVPVTSICPAMVAAKALVADETAGNPRPVPAICAASAFVAVSEPRNVNAAGRSSP